MSLRVLVTGGAGYVGSHVVLALRDAGHAVVVFDDLSQGHRAAVPDDVELVVADLADRAVLDPVIEKNRFDAVFHMASRSLVGESMTAPTRYLIENAATAFGLIEACVRNGVSRFVLSSTANLFGATNVIPIDETAEILPASPYGESKWMIERALAWAGKIHGLRHACLRFFNASGADPLGRAGEDHRPETHLIPLVIDAALGRRPPLTVFGTDYPTPDGTCIRDYVHVSDLAQAHLAVLAPLETRSVVYNLGSGHGHSVREVIASVERVSGRAVPWSAQGRRAGDPAVLVAGSRKIQAETEWRPSHTALDDIVATALNWRLRHPRGYDV
jgi:UDP-glucose 4-epimerase